MSFRDPLLLLLLLVIPVFVYRFLYRRNRDNSFYHSQGSLIKQVMGKAGEIKSIILYTINIAAFILFIISLAGPRSSKQYEKRLSEGVDLMIALDVSGSMQAVDDEKAIEIARRSGSRYFDGENKLRNRLFLAKNITVKFIKKRKNDRIGLIVFAGYSFTQCPLTFDHRLLIELLQKVDFSMVKDQGTAIGLAIANGINRLRKSKAKEKVIILITDGVNNSGYIDPITAAEIAKVMKIRVYTIGIGSRIPLIKTHKNSRNYMLHRKSYIDEDNLKKISKMTGGTYYRALKGVSLGEIYDKIDKMEKTIIEKKIFVEYNELFQSFLLWAVILLILSFFLKHIVFRTYP